MVLRAVCDNDLGPLHHKIFSVPDVMKWAFGGQVLSPPESDSFIGAHFGLTPSSIGLAVLVDKSNGAVLGIAGLNPCAALAEDDLEIGFVLAREAWGRVLRRRSGGRNSPSGSNTSVDGGYWPSLPVKISPLSTL
jgi:ribosomal-protein-alanine N-acetyltransferase